VRFVEHPGHAPGHAALVIEECRVLLAADMLSDVEIPLLDPDGADPVGDYLSALELLAAECERGIGTLVPGHGGVATGAEVGARLAADRHYVRSLQAGIDPADPRVGPHATYGTDWLPGEHERNRRLARR
jgi:glyoxylase-like metal-dependent hydrolase (beta-lactamase superfamily II)